MKKAVAAAILLALLFAAAWNICASILSPALSRRARTKRSHTAARRTTTPRRPRCAKPSSAGTARRTTRIMIRHAEVVRRPAFTPRSSRSSRTTPTQPRALSNVSKRICKSIGSMEHVSFRERILSLVLQKMRQLFHEGVDILELAVDRGKADVGDLVE